MFKYLCLMLLVGQIYAAPVDDKDAVDSYDDQIVTEVDEKVDTQKKFSATKPPKVVEILEYGSDHQTDGSYSFHYRGADGSYREETAVLKNPGTDDEHLAINGAYAFIDADGKEVVVHYKADDKGFVPIGSNIPDVISVAARENSQIPAVKQYDDKNEDVDDSADVSDVLHKKENN